MNIKVLASMVALALGSTTCVIAQADTESSRSTTIEQSTTVTPQANTKVEEETTTTKTKRGLFGRKKTETTTTNRYERDPDTMTNSEFKSRTTIEKERSY